MSEHYFTASPAGPAEEREHSFVIRGTRHTVTTASGVFSADRLDRGTQVLLDRVPDPPESGLLLDLGCGWGPIALALADAAPGATVLATDVNERAIDLAARNAAAAGHTNIHAAEATTLATELRGSNTYVDLEGYSVGGGAGHGVAGRFMAALSCLDHLNAVGPSGRLFRGCQSHRGVVGAGAGPTGSTGPAGPTGPAGAPPLARHHADPDPRATASGREGPNDDGG